MRAAISAERTNSSRILSISVRVSARGIWFSALHGTAEAAITSQLSEASGASDCSQPSWVEPFGPEWPS